MPKTRRALEAARQPEMDFQPLYCKEFDHEYRKKRNKKDVFESQTRERKKVT